MALSKKQQIIIMIFSEDLKYSKEHTWLLISNNIGSIGITAFAQSELVRLFIPTYEMAIIFFE